jgi:type III restriction enzyme
MIRRTIREHLDKEKRLRPQGIKVLSLFFIDQVSRYRQYNEHRNAVKGEYARIFEEEYRRAANHPDYRTLFDGVDLSFAAEEVHDGYFSIDKRGGWTDTAENNEANRENAERAYNLIMKDKEKLLSLDTPLKFIFSHSALKEGWDNPNVFQICTLRDVHSERERRQTIGRGLRICVNQDGHRVHGFDVNTLTVVALESYEQFAASLQKEIEEDTGIRFGVVEPYQFAALSMVDAEGQLAYLGYDHSRKLWGELKRQRYIDAKGNIQDSLRQALKDDTVQVPLDFHAQRDQIVAVLKKLAGRLEIRDADERRPIAPRRAVLDSREFKQLWDRIKHKTTYRLHFDNEQLVQQCIVALRDAPAIPKARLQWRKADLAIGDSGVAAVEKEGAAIAVLDETDVELPDILTELQDRTQLTRRTIVRVLTASERLSDFLRNPQQFIEIASEAINRCKRLVLVDGIKYEKLGSEHYYAQELFEARELTGYLRNMLATRKSVYESVVYDSPNEAQFARQLESHSDVKVYAKLPGWFTIPTPLGSYNPDWAVLIENDGIERLYFVVETKTSMFAADAGNVAAGKIQCARVHFDSMAVDGDHAKYRVARTLDELLSTM